MLKNFYKLLFIIFCMNNSNILAMDTKYFNFPKNIQVLYNSNLGVKVIMDFKIYNNTYHIYTNLRMPLYKIKYISDGKIGKNGILSSVNFKDERNRSLYSIANIDNNTHKISYGKINNIIFNNIDFHIYDPFSFAWQFAFNQQAFTKNIKITNGKKLYDFVALSDDELNKLIINKIIIKSKKNNILKLAVIALKKQNSMYLNNFDFNLAENFYNIPIITKLNMKDMIYNLNVNKIIIDNKVVWDINN